MDKTQRQIDNEYACIDLPELLRRKDERRAAELMEHLQISSYPHISDKRAREQIVGSITVRMPQAPKEPTKSADEQYQALLARMRGGM